MVSILEVNKKVGGKKRMDFDKKYDAVMHQAEEWAGNFTKSLFYKQLSKEQRSDAGFIVERYIDFMFNYCDRMPGKWTQKDTIDVIGYYFPRKISADATYFSCVVPVLEKFFQFLSSQKRIKNEETLIRGLKKAETELMDNVDNPDMWGPAKQLAMSAEESGVDLSNQDELDAFVAMLNQQIGAAQKFEVEKQKATRPQLSVKKIGRNDPCPCGSGKKYKKCHGFNGKVIDFPEK